MDRTEELLSLVFANTASAESSRNLVEAFIEPVLPGGFDRFRKYIIKHFLVAPCWGRAIHRQSESTLENDFFQLNGSAMCGTENQRFPWLGLYPNSRISRSAKSGFFVSTARPNLRFKVPLRPYLISCRPSNH